MDHAALDDPVLTFTGLPSLHLEFGAQQVSATVAEYSMQCAMPLMKRHDAKRPVCYSCSTA